MKKNEKGQLKPRLETVKPHEGPATEILFDKLSRTSLHLACRDGRAAAVRLLLKYGADVNGLNENEETVP